MKSSTTTEAKFAENSLLVIGGLVAHAPLYYQLPRWANGLNPMFVHDALIQHSRFPLVLYLAKIHPIIWITVLVVIFVRICSNYGWKLQK